MDEVRIGVIGCGGMGQAHMKVLSELPRVKLVAASDSFEDSLRKVGQEYELTGFNEGEDLLESELVDAVVIATPHYFHPTYSIAALKRGIHVLTEKPVSVTAKAAQEVNDEAAKHPDLKYAAMFQMRTNPMWCKIHDLIASGQIGEIQRLHWTATAWFRSQAYYNSGGWRATWEGECGGVLLNQCPHNLDLLYWLTGAAKKVHAHASFGKYHDIEVEDEVTAYFEYENGATGVFIASTGEAPGTNYLEIVGDRGRIRMPGNNGSAIELIDNGLSTSEYCRTTDNMWGFPPSTTMNINTPDGGSHKDIHQNFVDAILDGAELIAPAAEGIHSVEMANAMIMSAKTGQAVDVPTDRDAYEDLLKQLIEEANEKKAAAV